MRERCGGDGGKRQEAGRDLEFRRAGTTVPVQAERFGFTGRQDSQTRWAESTIGDIEDQRVDAGLKSLGQPDRRGSVEDALREDAMGQVRIRRVGRIQVDAQAVIGGQRKVEHDGVFVQILAVGALQRERGAIADGAGAAAITGIGLIDVGCDPVRAGDSGPAGSLSGLGFDHNGGPDEGSFLDRIRGGGVTLVLPGAVDVDAGGRHGEGDRIRGGGHENTGQ